MSELLRDGNALTEQDKTDIRNGIGLGTAATLNVPSSGNATSGQVVKGDDTRLTDSREWTAATVDQTEAEDGTATTRRAWTAQRVRQAISAWWAASAGSLLKTINGNSLLGSGDLTIGGGGGATNLSYIASATGGTVSSDTGTDATLPLSDGTNAGLMALAQHSKLAGIAAGATANSSDATLLNRANHTGTQAAATISDSTEAGRALLTAADAAAQRTALGLGTAATTAASAYATSAQGVPAGGTTGQVLAKTSATDYAVGWTTSPGGGSPGGSSGQFQYNNAGAFAGTSAITTNGVSIIFGSAGWSTPRLYESGYTNIGWATSAGNWYFVTSATSGAGIFGLHAGDNAAHIYTKLGFGTGVPSASVYMQTTAGLSSAIEVNNGTAGTFRDMKMRSLIQQPPASITPASNGDLVFEATSNTTITVKLKGSDGTVRTGTITLS